MTIIQNGLTFFFKDMILSHTESRSIFWLLFEHVRFRKWTIYHIDQWADRPFVGGDGWNTFLFSMKALLTTFWITQWWSRTKQNILLLWVYSSRKFLSYSEYRKDYLGFIPLLIAKVKFDTLLWHEKLLDI